jgi:hypothetical protein
MQEVKCLRDGSADHAPKALTLADTTLHMFNWRVKVPTGNRLNATEHVWVLRTAFGIDEVDSLREVVENYPDALEVLPKDFRESMPALKNRPKPAPKVLCAAIDARDAGHWCRHCGQDERSHPIMEGTMIGESAKTWMKIAMSEGEGYFWD